MYTVFVDFEFAYREVDQYDMMVMWKERNLDHTRRDKRKAKKNWQAWDRKGIRFKEPGQSIYRLKVCRIKKLRTRYRRIVTKNARHTLLRILSRNHFILDNNKKYWIQVQTNIPEYDVDGKFQLPVFQDSLTMFPDPRGWWEKLANAAQDRDPKRRWTKENTIQLIAEHGAELRFDPMRVVFNKAAEGAMFLLKWA